MYRELYKYVQKVIDFPFLGDILYIKASVKLTKYYRIERVKL